MHRNSILVVDDDQITIARVIHALEPFGLSVDAAHDGFEALEMLRRQDYAVILLDLLMPKLDGFGVLHFISECRPNLRKRVIVSTALDDVTGSAPILDGTYTVLSKPIDYSALPGRVLACIAANEADGWADAILHG